MRYFSSSRYNEKGRSMIEMLGVLAIVGVLSVGGLAGYNMAMQKIRINKVVEELERIIQETALLMDTLSDLKEGEIYPGIDTRFLEQAVQSCSSSAQIKGPSRGNVNGFSMFNFFFYNLPTDLCQSIVMADIETVTFCDYSSGSSCQGTVFIHPRTEEALNLCKPDKDGHSKTILMRLFTRK